MMTLIFRNSSALPSVGEMVSDKEISSKDNLRKKSVLLPNGNSIIDSKGGGSSLAVGGSNIVGGIDNYKRYQMLVSQQKGITGAGSSLHDKSYKRSSSLLGE